MIKGRFQKVEQSSSSPKDFAILISVDVLPHAEKRKMYFADLSKFRILS
jgi:hypothetical protein